MLTRLGMPADLLAALAAAADGAGVSPEAMAARILAEELPVALASAARYAFAELLDAPPHAEAPRTGRGATDALTLHKVTESLPPGDPATGPPGDGRPA